MIDDAAAADRKVDPAELQQFLLYLGSALTACGEAVNEIQQALLAVAHRYGATEARVVVLPTFLEVALDPRQPVTLEPTKPLRGVLRLGQIAAVYDVLRDALRGDVEPDDGVTRIIEIVASEPRYGTATRIVAHAVLTAGLCLVLQPTGPDIALAAAFGLVVGILKEFGSRWARIQMIMPVLAAVFVSGATFYLADHHGVTADLRAMIAPLVTFLPGAALTTAVIELSAGELVTGASRLVAGGLQLVLLGFGIVAGASLAGLPDADELVNRPENLLGWWAPWLGVLVFGVAQYFYNSAPRGSFGWLMIVLLVAWTGEHLGGQVFDGYMSSFIGAFLMTITAKLIERFPTGPPAVVSFLPAFWLLVPGALSLIGVTEYLSNDQVAGLNDFMGAVGAIISIALGVLCGYPIVSAVTGRLERFDLPLPRLARRAD